MYSVQKNFYQRQPIIVNQEGYQQQQPLEQVLANQLREIYRAHLSENILEFNLQNLGYLCQGDITLVKNVLFYSADSVNNPYAQYYIGLMYYKGHYFHISQTKATVYLDRAINGGILAAYYVQALRLFAEGAHSVERAQKFLIQAANGVPQAMVLLAEKYEANHQQQDRVLELLQKAANMENKRAQFKLAGILMNKRGRRAEGYKCMCRAGELGHTYACYYLQQMHQQSNNNINNSLYINVDFLFFNNDDNPCINLYFSYEFFCAAEKNIASSSSSTEQFFTGKNQLQNAKIFCPKQLLQNNSGSVVENSNYYPFQLQQQQIYQQQYVQQYHQQQYYYQQQYFQPPLLYYQYPYQTQGKNQQIFNGKKINQQNLKLFGKQNQANNQNSNIKVQNKQNNQVANFEGQKNKHDEKFSPYKNVGNFSLSSGQNFLQEKGQNQLQNKNAGNFAMSSGSDFKRKSQNQFQSKRFSQKNMDDDEIFWGTSNIEKSEKKNNSMKQPAKIVQKVVSPRNNSYAQQTNIDLEKDQTKKTSSENQKNQTQQKIISDDDEQKQIDLYSSGQNFLSSSSVFFENSSEHVDQDLHQELVDLLLGVSSTPQNPKSTLNNFDAQNVQFEGFKNQKINQNVQNMKHVGESEAGFLDLDALLPMSVENDKSDVEIFEQNQSQIQNQSSSSRFSENIEKEAFIREQNKIYNEFSSSKFSDNIEKEVFMREQNIVFNQLSSGRFSEKIDTEKNSQNFVVEQTVVENVVPVVPNQRINNILSSSIESTKKGAQKYHISQPNSSSYKDILKNKKNSVTNITTKTNENQKLNNKIAFKLPQNRPGY